MLDDVAKSKGGDPPTDALAPWLRLGDEPGVAPLPLERVRALLNTDNRYAGVDALADGPAELVTFRDAVRAYLTAGDAGGLDALAGRHPLTVRVGRADDGGSTTVLAPAPGLEGLTGALAVLLADLHGAHADGTWHRLKACSNPACGWVFYDTSRNRSGRWCAMGECGDVMKARTYRERRRTAPPGPPAVSAGRAG